MNKEKINKLHNKSQRKTRIRSTLSGSKDCPRLTISISNRHIAAQLVDDSNSITIFSATTVGKKNSSQTMTQKAENIGTEIAKGAKSKKVSQIVFDRNGKKYHGRIKVLADSARKEGLKF